LIGDIVHPPHYNWWVRKDPISDVLGVFFESFDAQIPYDVVAYSSIDDGTVRQVWQVWRRSKVSVEQKIHVGFHLPLHETSLYDLAESQRPRVIDDTVQYLKERPESVGTQLVVAEGIRSSLTHPVVVDGATVGFLFFSSIYVGTYRGVGMKSVSSMVKILEIVITQELQQQKLAADYEQQAEAAHRDRLTGLLNRRGLELALSSEMTSQRHYGAIFVDMDKMKPINDTRGHSAGDAALLAVTTGIRQHVRDRDFVARVGGDEFVAVLPGVTNLTRLEHICESIRASIETGAAGTVSIGAVHSDRMGVSVLDLIAEADEAMYESKRRGGNCTTVRPARS